MRPGRFLASPEQQSANRPKILFIYIKMHLQLHREHGSVQIAGHADGSAVHVHDLLGNGKPPAPVPPVLLDLDLSTR